MAHLEIDDGSEIARSRVTLDASHTSSRDISHDILQNSFAPGTAPKSFDRARLRMASVGAAVGVVAIMILVASASRVQADVTYTYDNVGRLLCVRDSTGNGIARTYTYDSVGNVTLISVAPGGQCLPSGNSASLMSGEDAAATWDGKTVDAVDGGPPADATESLPVEPTDSAPVEAPE
jgi:YD repeat-containing protein